MERYLKKHKEKETQEALDHIFSNAFGNPIQFDSAPTLSQMKGNTWGYYGTTIYIKFGNNTGISISGSSLT